MERKIFKLIRLSCLAIILIITLLSQSCKFRDPNNQVVEEFYPNGVIKSRTPYKNGVIEGTVTNFNERGILLSTAEYKNGKHEGIMINYNTATQKPVIKATFKNDIQEGPVIQYYREGMVWRESNYVNGRIDGEMKTYWASGKIKALSYFKMGIPATGLKEYDKEGKLLTNPAIVVQEVDQLALLNKVIIKLSLSKEVNEVEFYLDELKEGKYFDPKSYKLRTDNFIATIEYPVPRGNIFMKELSFVAKCKTKYDNTLILQKKYKLVANNSY